jgi:hypothetical protein
VVITPADLAAAVVFLSVLEGFRRIAPDKVVITWWKGQCRAGSSPLCLWLRSIGWLWLAPLQAGPRTFLCRTDTAFASPRSGTEALQSVRLSVETIHKRYKRLSVITTAQAWIILVGLPALALFGWPVAIYTGLMATLVCSAAVAAGLWREQSWNALKYAIYPPSSLFALADQTLYRLEEEDFDAIVAAVLDDDGTRTLLRRAYRMTCFGPLSEASDFANVRARITELCNIRQIPPEYVLGDPRPTAPGVISFCPCCEAEFVIPEGECCDCPGVQIQQFRKQVGRW